MLELLGGGALEEAPAAPPPQAAVSSADDDDPPPPSLCEFQEVKTILDNVSLSTESLRKGYDALTEALYGIDNLELQLLEHADNAKSGLSQAVIKLKATEAALEVEAELYKYSNSRTKGGCY